MSIDNPETGRRQHELSVESRIALAAANLSETAIRASEVFEPFPQIEPIAQKSSDTMPDLSFVVD